MKLSVIIPCFNEEKTIGNILNAVKNSGIQDQEIIVVDDNSSDNTIEIVKNFPVQLFHYEGEYLPGKSLNFGVSKCFCHFLGLTKTILTSSISAIVCHAP